MDMINSDDPEKNQRATIRIGLLLTDGFAMMSYAALIEPFRAANALSRQAIYDWTHLSRDGQAVTASNGARVMVDAGAETGLGDRIDCDMVFVFAGGDLLRHRDHALSGWLRMQARRGVTIGGISAGPFLLARAGLLAGRRATIHWEHAAAMREECPDVALESGLFVIDGNIITCAGGTAGLDLALALIARDRGADLAARVGEWFIRTDMRDAAGPQRPGPAERHRTTNRAVLAALAVIEARLDQSLDRADLARGVGLSLRQLERLFVAHRGQGIAATIWAIRLDAAAHLLRSTDRSVTEIAFECGFASAAHFSRRFRARLGMAPSQMRGG